MHCHTPSKDQGIDSNIMKEMRCPRLDTRNLDAAPGGLGGDKASKLVSNDGESEAQLSLIHGYNKEINPRDTIYTRGNFERFTTFVRAKAGQVSMFDTDENFYSKDSANLLRGVGREKVGYQLTRPVS